MAPTFVVETGAGLSNANSYADIAFLDQEFENTGNPTEWTSLTTPQKEDKARIHTQYLDAQYHERWRGRRTNQLQRLDHPREDIIDDDGFPIGSDEIALPLKRALVEAIRANVVDGLTLLGSQSDPGFIEEEAVGAGRGAVTERIKYLGGKDQEPFVPMIERLLAPLLRPEGSLVRG